MIPRKAKEFIKPTAEKLGCSEDLVDTLTNFYWQAVRQALSNPTKVAVAVGDFGVFNVKPWKLQQFIIEYDRIIDNTDLDTFRKYAAIKQLEKKKIILDKLILEIEELKLKKQQIKDKRNGNNKTDLGSEETHS